MKVSLTSVNKGKKHKILSVPTKSISYFSSPMHQNIILEQTVNILIFYTYLICFKKKKELETRIRSNKKVGVAKNTVNFQKLVAVKC